MAGLMKSRGATFPLSTACREGVREALWNGVDGPPRSYAWAAGLLEVSFLWRTVKHVLLSPISLSGDQLVLPSLKIVSTPSCIAYSASVTQMTQALVTRALHIQNTTS